MTDPRKLLVIAHGHPKYSAGGAENAAYALHRSFLQRQGWDSFYLAACGDSTRFTHEEIHRLTPDPEALFFARGAGQSPDARVSPFTTSLDLSLDGELSRLVQELQPDVIHLHHLLHFGLAAVAALRQWIPDVRIILTLHEFLLLCPQGQLLKLDGEFCEGPGIQGCQCCGWLNQRDRLLRLEAAKELLEWVDLLISPSQTLVREFVANGWPEKSFCVVENLLPQWIHSPSVRARASAARALKDQNDFSLHSVFGFFGNCQQAKGLDLVLKAFAMTRRRYPHARLQVHGPVESVFTSLSNSPFSSDQDYLQRLRFWLQQLEGFVELCGPYSQEKIIERMSGVGWVVMASRWLENSPVVIQEARACGRPLLVPDVGGMAEKVRPGLDGWQWAFGDVFSLANQMEFCCKQPDEWLRLKNKICQANLDDQVMSMHEAIYLSENKSSSFRI